MNTYTDEYKRGTRAIDYFAQATAVLITETLRTRADVLGKLYKSQISYGEHGQFFTPQNVAAMMAQIRSNRTKVRRVS